MSEYYIFPRLFLYKMGKKGYNRKRCNAKDIFSDNRISGG